MQSSINIIKNHTYFIYENAKKQRFFVVANAKNNDYIEEINITNYDFKQKDFDEFYKIEKISNEDFENYKEYFKIKTKLAVYLLIYCGY